MGAVCAAVSFGIVKHFCYPNLGTLKQRHKLQDHEARRRDGGDLFAALAECLIE